MIELNDLQIILQNHSENPDVRLCSINNDFVDYCQSIFLYVCFKNKENGFDNRGIFKSSWD
jgi:hypothetical protein